MNRISSANPIRLVICLLSALLLFVGGAWAKPTTLEQDKNLDFTTINGAGSALNEALDNTRLSFSTSGGANWFPETTSYFYGGSAAQSGDIPDSISPGLLTRTSLQATVVGPGTLSFYWKVSSEEFYDCLELYMDVGDPKDSISGEVDWTQRTFFIPAGSHTITWQYSKDDSGSSGSDCGWVDFVDFIPLNEALDNTQLNFSTSGGADWFPQTATYFYGGSAARSGGIADSISPGLLTRTSLQATVVGPGALSFYWKVSSEEQADYLDLYIDGVDTDWISGEVDWTQRTFSIPAGSHTISWEYSKDDSGSAGSDCGWVDKVVYSRAGASAIPLLLLE